MNIEITDSYIPGTILKKSDIGVTGLEFLDKLFFLSDGIMLSQIREIAGLDSSTIQNWVKRGWLGNTVHKQYSKMQLARLLIINMLRSTMKLEKIDFLLHYINGNLDSRLDDIIPEPVLFDYICRIIDRLEEGGGLADCARLREIIAEITDGYVERLEGAMNRLRNALEIIIISYHASVVAAYSDERFKELKGE